MPELPQPYPDEALASAGLPHLLSAILRRGEQSGRLIHVAEFPGSPGHSVPWPAWVPPEITQAMSRAGLARPWAHQAAMAEQAHQGRNVIISTPAASGKSLGYLVPALTAVLSGGTVLYLAPTRALAADQLCAIEALAVPGVCAAVVDGDTLAAERERARAHATYLLTTPDMLHHVLLPRHHRWDGFFGRLRYVIVDECHGYRGVFGSHVSHVLRRLRRIAAHHARQHQGHTSGPSAGPVFLLASATISEPGSCARLLTGEDAAEITESAAPRGPVTFGLWEPPLTPSRGSGEPPARRAATTETATLLADLVRHGVRTLAFTRSRRGAEAVALATRRLLADGEAAAAGRVAAGNGRAAAGNGQVVAGAGQEGGRTANQGRPRPWCRSPPTGLDTSPTTAGTWKRRCGPGRSGAWLPPPLWNLASTSVALMLSSWPDGPEAGPPSGSRRDGPAGKGRPRSQSSSPAMTRSIRTWCTTLRHCWNSRWKPPSSTLPTPMCSHLTCVPLLLSCR